MPRNVDRFGGAERQYFEGGRCYCLSLSAMRAFPSDAQIDANEWVLQQRYGVRSDDSTIEAVQRKLGAAARRCLLWS